MTRLIDADALDEAMCRFSDATGEDMTHAIFYAHIAPTVDAVPVIRCKDCKHWESMPSSTGAPDIHRCRYWRHIGTVAYDFCGRAEREDNG